MEIRLLGQNRVGSVRVSLKAVECVLLRLRLDTLSKTCRADCWIESNIGTGVSFYGPGACMCEFFWPIRDADQSIFGPRVTSPAPCFVIRSLWKPMPRDDEGLGRRMSCKRKER